MRDALLEGNRDRFGTDANVAHRIPADEAERLLADDPAYASPFVAAES